MPKRPAPRYRFIAGSGCAIKKKKLGFDDSRPRRALAGGYNWDIYRPIKSGLMGLGIKAVVHAKLQMPAPLHRVTSIRWGCSITQYRSIGVAAISHLACANRNTERSLCALACWPGRYYLERSVARDLSQDTIEANIYLFISIAESRIIVAIKRIQHYLRRCH